MEREIYFPGFLKCMRMSPWTPIRLSLFGSPRSFGVVSGIYNSNRHLYWDDGWPRFYDNPLTFLRYQDFYGGRKIGPATISHRGHILGINGGEATVTVERLGLSWTLKCQPYEFWYVIEVGLKQAVFKMSYPLVLPGNLLLAGR